MKAYLLLLVLLPLCSAEQGIRCIGLDFLMVNNLQLDCAGTPQQACYTRTNGEKGCTTLENCSMTGWSCCYTDNCNN